MTGTLVNAGAIIAGGLVGLLLKKGIKESLNDAVMKMVGLSVLIIGANGVIAAMFSVNADGSLSDSGGILLLVSLVLGALAGELLRIDERMNALGGRIEERLHAEGFAKGFVTASLIFCVGTMSIMGSLDDGLRGDPSLLFVKSTLDGITSLVLASSLGAGVLASALPVLLYQGGITLLASFVSPYLSPELMGQISMVGNAVIMTIGINFIFGPKIKTANLLPAIFVPALYNLLTMLKTLWL